MYFTRLKSLILKIYRKLLKIKIINYRVELFNEFKEYLLKNRIEINNKSILEIGSKDGEDSRRLLSLKISELHMVDLPGGLQNDQQWFLNLSKEYNNIKSKYANIVFEKVYENKSFDVIWCTGVLYHNTEQLRFLRILYDLLKPGGVLVLESATTKNPKFINQNIVEIVYPVSDKIKKKYHISKNITHLPSKTAIRKWLQMLGYKKIYESQCHLKQSYSLSKLRAAYICIRPDIDKNFSSVVSKHAGYFYGRSI